ncbi:uncharacterized protein G2W53_026483 [Senna tora]|uniref:Uncharacterized protein n=1 Tax=Senna tora TaxID=362788 RepID=A0A834WHG5_9FABA|nr:uncharacterized protein G2W53_026483 [Senna tora]
MGKRKSLCKGLECAYLRKDMISLFIAFGLNDVAWTCRK